MCFCRQGRRTSDGSYELSLPSTHSDPGIRRGVHARSLHEWQRHRSHGFSDAGTHRNLGVADRTCADIDDRPRTIP